MMNGRLMVAAAVGVALALPLFATMKTNDIRRDVRYSEVAPCCVGDLYLPDGWTAETPVVLAIHGGGWSAMDKKDVAGVADFLMHDCGCAVYNVNYRLVSAKNPWPACGEDCVAAAKWLLSDAFAAKYGLKPKKIWVQGGSAGGHLALWTGLKLPAEQVAGIVSISGIADTNCEKWGKVTATWKGVNPIDLIRPNGPRILLTHATEDRVVTIDSAKSFARAYRAAGNELAFFEYPSETEHGLAGHCIWRPGSNPHRLIQTLERHISYFMLPPRVPAPVPAKSDIEITALYYPGTEHMSEWDMMRMTRPESKPLLGWYDEGDPEAIDWQIKWAVEHGITSFSVDWYWNRGYRRLTHWLKGFYQAKYRRNLKWFMMYANHNQPGAHSTADQIAVTKFWIDNYFKTPEYYTIDGKPCVCYWSTTNLDRDIIAEAAAKGEKLGPGEGLKRAFAISERLVKEAGLPGIHWIDMWRTMKFDRAYAKELARLGCRSAMHYGIEFYAPKLSPEAMQPGDTASVFSYDAVVATAPKVWDELSVQDVLPFDVLLPTGWDDRPRSFANARVITKRTPEKFAAVCRQARAFCDRHGKKRVLVMPINEWQEGSYIEPNEEFGFGMYDAIRDAFCEKPATGWPKNLKPSDVGLGPYDFPASYRSPVPSWTFDTGSMDGWYRQPYGGGELEAKDGCLNFWVTRVGNFNIRQCVQPFDAAKYRAFRIRLRITPNKTTDLSKHPPQTMRLKWGTSKVPIVKPGVVLNDGDCVASCSVVCDGQFHEYTLDLAANPDWKGLVDELWLETSQLMHARVAIDWMRCE